MTCKHYTSRLTEEDRYYVDSKEHNNCVFCLIKEKGPMTQDEVAKYFNMSKMRVCQLEKRAMRKLSRKLNILGE